MKTLLTIFSKERSELKTEIDKATSVEQAVKLVQNRISSLERNYVSSGLSVAQVRLASFFLETLRQSIATLTAANETRVPHLEEAEKIINQATRSPNSLILKLLQGLICAATLASLLSLTQTAPGAWVPILLVSVLVGLEALQLEKDKQENISGFPQPGEAPQPTVTVDSKVLLDNLADALNTIDLAVAPAEEVKKPLDSSGIEESPELLNLLQRLMGASFLERPQMALELTKLLPQILIEQGIRPQIYLPNDESSQRGYFDFEPSIDRAKDYVTVAPALVKGDRVLRRGRVIEPAYSETRD